MEGNMSKNLSELNNTIIKIRWSKKNTYSLSILNSNDLIRFLTPQFD